MTAVIFSVKAEHDLEQIGDYIAEDNPHRALLFVRELRDQCRKNVSIERILHGVPEISWPCSENELNF